MLDFHNGGEETIIRAEDCHGGCGFCPIISKIWIEVPLLLIALLLFVWGLEPEGTEEFVGRLPYAGDYILKALAKLNSVLSRWN